MNKTLFVSDLDGTLLNTQSKISNTSAELLNKSIRQGKLFTIATARTPATVANLIKPVNIQIPAIVMTGAMIWNPETGIYSDKHFISPLAAKQALETLKNNNTPAFLFTLNDNLINIYHFGGPLNNIERQFMEQRLDTPYKKFHILPDGRDLLPSDLSNTILIYGMQPTPIAQNAYHALQQIPDIRPQFYHDQHGPTIGEVEAFAPNATKANAVKLLKQRTGASQVIAFGDNINDLPMLRAADIAVAVENAIPEVKQEADIIIGPNSLDSVARFIYEYKQ